ncbi:hypothetical protein ACY1J9_001244 [Clostridium botulinum]
MEEILKRKEFISVFKPEIARKLLKRHYQVVDIKPFKEDPKRSFFIFKNEGDFEKDLLHYMSKMK